jgi:catechol 2,3-dioxygenase-like lactoylglutathione lyase family enzyme
VEFDTGATTFALHADDKLPGQRDERTIVCFGVDDIQATYEALKSRGVKFDGEPHIVCEAEGKTGKSADFRDPDGNRLSIFGYVKK